MKIVEYKYALNDVFVEILQQITWNKLEEIEPLKDNYIQKLDSIWNGFNGMFMYQFKYNGILKQGKNLALIAHSKQRMELERENIKQMVNQRLKTDLAMEWIYYQIKSVPSLKEQLNSSQNQIFNNYCKKILKILNSKKEIQ